MPFELQPRIHNELIKLLPLEAGDFARFRHDLNFGQTADPVLKAYRKALLEALEEVQYRETDIAVMSVFTTQSATTILEKIRNQIKTGPAAAAAGVQIFPRVPSMTVVFNRQVRVSGNNSIGTSFLPVDLFDPSGHIGALVFGRYTSPDYETAAKYIPPVGTRTGSPMKQADAQIYFNLFVPAGTAPAARSSCSPTGWSSRAAGAASIRTVTAPSTRPRGSTPRSRARSSATATGCAKPWWT